MRQLCLCLMLCIAAQPCLAQNESYDLSIDCKRVAKEGGNNYEMGQCAGRERLAAQARLDRALEQLRNALPPGDARQALAESQARWLAWKPKESALCARALGYSPDGSGYGLAWSSCAANLTTQRIQVLQRYWRDIQSR